jgi:predicted amidohydrolase YtcJ
MTNLRSSLAVICAAALAAACSTLGLSPKPSAIAPADADVTIFTGGVIYTGLEDMPTVEAVAVSDGVVLAIGGRDLIKRAASGKTAIVDLDGAAMYPGFTDAHAHLLGIGMRELTLNLEGVASVAELVSVVSANVQQTGEGETLFGRGWIETGWPEGRTPSRIDLDPVSRNNPVVLRRADGHAVVANSAALDAAGIDDDTPDPDGGRIERDQYGRATGILIDNAMGLVASLISAPSQDKKREAFAKGSDVYAAYGWTGLHNMSVDPANVDMMEALSADGAINIRVYNAIDKSGMDWLAGRIDEQRCILKGLDYEIDCLEVVQAPPKIITRTVKLYVDGALGSRGALLAEPYFDAPETSGLLLMQEDDAKELFNRAIPAGVQIVTHAIGDLGNTLVLNWYEDVFSEHPDAGDLRWRIEHAQILDTDDIPRFAELGVIPSMQPSHAIGDLFFAPDRLGPDRLDGAYAWRSLIDAGAIIPGGSDAPVERGDPLIEFYAAVARRGLDGTQTPDWRPGQAVTRKEALKMFTIWPAYASFQEDVLGTIEPGKRADFTVFSKDIMTVGEDEILSAKPVMTVIDGEIVFQARD